MKRLTCALLVIPLLGACGSEPTPHAVEVKDVVGFWHVSLTPDPACTRTNPTTALDLTLTVLGHTDADTLTLQGGWELAPVSNPARPLDGTLDLRTGAFHADLTTSEPTTRARLEGTFGAGPALTGTLTDPASGTNTAILGTGSCSYVAAGQH